MQRSQQVKTKKAVTEDRNLQEYEEVMATGKMTCRTPVDNRFRRQHTPSSEAGRAFNDLDDEAKKEYKIKWAQQQHANIMKKKTFEEKLTKTSRTKGTKLTFGGLVLKYGGWS